MKPILLALALALLCGLSASAQDVDKMPMITVTGAAEIEVPPDEATLTLVVAKTDKDLQLAKQQNDEAIAKILELSRRFSISPQNVKTDYISVEMKYDQVRDPKLKVYDQDGLEITKQVFRGYEVSKTVIVKLSDISRFEDFFTEILKTGVTEVSNITFTTAKLRQYKDQARDQAMKAAREKAVAMSASVGQTVGRAIRVTEGSNNSGYYKYAQNTSASANERSVEGSYSDTATTFAPGSVTVSAQITVSFALN